MPDRQGTRRDKVEDALLHSLAVRSSRQYAFSREISVAGSGKWRDRLTHSFGFSNHMVKHVYKQTLVKCRSDDDRKRSSNRADDFCAFLSSLDWHLIVIIARDISGSYAFVIIMITRWKVQRPRKKPRGVRTPIHAIRYTHASPCLAHICTVIPAIRRMSFGA